jgi:hypothetical protein
MLLREMIDHLGLQEYLVQLHSDGSAVAHDDDCAGAAGRRDDDDHMMRRRVAEDSSSAVSYRVAC